MAIFEEEIKLVKIRSTKSFHTPTNLRTEENESWEKRLNEIIFVSKTNNNRPSHEPRIVF